MLECRTMRGDAARRACGHAPKMPIAASLGKITSVFQKTLIFRKSLEICGQVVAKAKATHMGALPRLGM